MAHHNHHKSMGSVKGPQTKCQPQEATPSRIIDFNCNRSHDVASVLSGKLDISNKSCCCCCCCLSNNDLTVQIVGGWKVLCCCWSGLGEGALCWSAGLGAATDVRDDEVYWSLVLFAIVVVSNEVPSGLRNHDATDAHYKQEKTRCRIKLTERRV